MFKVAALLKRKPGMSVEKFQEYWYHRHGPLMTKCPEVRRYVQSAALLQGYRKGELPFDGIGEIWLDSEDAFQAFLNGPGAAEMSSDEVNFLDRSHTVLMPVDVHVIKDGMIPEGAVKSIELVTRRPGMALNPFRDYWRNVHGPIASRISSVLRYEQNHLKQSAYETDEMPAYDGLAVTWFASTADMKRGAETPEYRMTRADEPNFLPDGHLPLIITREHVLIG